MPDKPRMAQTKEAVIHLRLRTGEAACGMLKGQPPQWPNGHLWVRRERGFMLNCPHCQRILQETQNASPQ